MEKVIKEKLSRIDSDSRFNDHRLMLSRYSIKRKVFKRIQNWIISESHLAEDVKFVGIELGAGVIPISEINSNFKSSDYCRDSKPSWIDLSVNACQMPFNNESVDVFLCQNSFHHFPDHLQFLAEAERCLSKNGKLIIFEPYHSILGKIFFKFLSANESFDQKGSLENNRDQKRMSGANQAISYIVFIREWENIQRKFNFNLKIMKICPSPFTLNYINCGGINFKPFFTSPSIDFIDYVDKKLSIFHFLYSLHYLIIIEKITKEEKKECKAM